MFNKSLYGPFLFGLRTNNGKNIPLFFDVLLRIYYIINDTRMLWAVSNSGRAFNYSNSSQLSVPNSYIRV